MIYTAPGLRERTIWREWSTEAEETFHQCLIRPYENGEESEDGGALHSDRSIKRGQASAPPKHAGVRSRFLSRLPTKLQLLQCLPAGMGACGRLSCRSSGTEPHPRQVRMSMAATGRFHSWELSMWSKTCSLRSEIAKQSFLVQ
ncbi:hypothetical protein ACGC1H_004369 [Rhizoctonia solani]